MLRLRSLPAVAATLVLTLGNPLTALAQERSAEAPGPYHDSGLELGALAPDFALESLAGQAYRLSEARGERPILLLFFRGTW